MRRFLCSLGAAASLVAAFGAAGQSSALKQAAGASVPCAQGLFTGSVGAPSVRIQLCSEAERLVPQLAATLAQVQRQLSAQDHEFAETRRLIRNANAASQRAGARQIEMAQALHAKIEALLAQPPAASLRGVRRLSDDLEQVVEQIEKVEHDERKRDALGTVIAAIQEAVAALDLDRAGKLLASVEAIQAQLTGVSRDVGALKEIGEESRNTAVFAEAQRTRARGEIGQTRVLAQLVAQGRTFDRHDLAGIAFSGLQAPGLRAREADLALAWLDGAALPRADLKGASLLASNLERTVFDGADLGGVRAALARARGAGFAKADLSLGNWVGADLRDANLAGARLVGASLEHADLRGADLRGTDLTGAFLGNADLRGARLDGAVLRNTDVSFALLSQEALTAQQAAGLCATPGNGEREQSWRVIERIPSSRFEGGYQHAQIFEKQLYLGLGGHRPYPRCKMRDESELPEWNSPVFAHGGNEFWNDGLSFRVDHGLVDGSRRRSELRERLEAVTAAARQRPRHLAELPQFAEIQARLYKALDERLATLTRKLALPPSLPMDRETAHLLMLRLRPDLLEQMAFDWRAASQAGFWGYPADKDAAASGWTWPRLYPAGLLRDDLSDVTSKAFQAWSRARAAAIGNVPVLMDYQRSNAGPGATWSSILVYESRAGQADAELARRLGVAPERVAVYHGSLPPTYGNANSVPVAVVADGDLAAFATWAARQPAAQRTSVPVQVYDVRWLTPDPAYSNRAWLVWFVRWKVPA